MWIVILTVFDHLFVLDPEPGTPGRSIAFTEP